MGSQANIILWIGNVLDGLSEARQASVSFSGNTFSYPMTDANGSHTVQIIVDVNVTTVKIDGSTTDVAANYDINSVTIYGSVYIYFPDVAVTVQIPDESEASDTYQEQIDNLEDSIMSVYNSLSADVSELGSGVTDAIEGILSVALKCGGVLIIAFIAFKGVGFFSPNLADLL